jgi:hypothetical protein
MHKAIYALFGPLEMAIVELQLHLQIQDCSARIQKMFSLTFSVLPVLERDPAPIVRVVYFIHM